MSQDPSQNSIIRRLLHYGGRWILEVEYVELIDPNILRPVVRCTEGNLEILEELSRHPSMADQSVTAQRMMQTPAPPEQEDRAWRPHQDRWVQVAFTPPVSLQEHRTPQAVAIAETARVESDKLVHAIEQLRGRIKHLETQASRAQQSEARVAELVGRNQLLEQRLAALESRLASGQLPVAQPEDTPALPPPETVSEDISEMPPPLPSPVHFPEADALGESLQQLVGDSVGLSDLPHKSATKFGHGSTGWYIAAMLDDQMRVAGAMLADSKATIQIGGSLMMLPASEIQSQQRSRSPSDDVLAAMSEVFNTLNATVNLVADNPHTHTNYLEPLDFDRFAWIAAPAVRLDLKETAGGGIVAFLSRDPADMAANG